MKFTRLLSIGILSVGLSAPAVLAQTRLDDGTSERRRAAEAARAEIDAARSRVTAATARVRASWKANPDMMAAEKEAGAARDAYEAARKPIIEKLKGTDEYKKALSDEAAAAAKVEAEKKEAGPPPAPVENPRGPAAATLPTTQPEALDISAEHLDAANKALEKRTATTRLEEAAIAADPSANEAKAKLEAAAAKVQALQAQLDATLLNDADFKSAKQALADAQARMATAPAAAGNNGRRY